MTPITKHRRSDDATGRKAVLYCPECGHESPIGGDWLEHPETDRERVGYACPACGHVVTTRPGRGVVA